MPGTGKSTGGRGGGGKCKGRARARAAAREELAHRKGKGTGGGARGTGHCKGHGQGSGREGPHRSKGPGQRGNRRAGREGATWATADREDGDRSQEGMGRAKGTARGGRCAGGPRSRRSRRCGASPPASCRCRRTTRATTTPCPATSLTMFFGPCSVPRPPSPPAAKASTQLPRKGCRRCTPRRPITQGRKPRQTPRVSACHAPPDS